MFGFNDQPSKQAVREYEKWAESHASFQVSASLICLTIITGALGYIYSGIEFSIGQRIALFVLVLALLFQFVMSFSGPPDWEEFEWRAEN